MVSIEVGKCALPQSHELGPIGVEEKGVVDFSSGNFARLIAYFFGNE